MLIIYLILLIFGFVGTRFHWLSDHTRRLVAKGIYFTYPFLVFSSLTKNFNREHIFSELALLPGLIFLMMGIGTVLGRFFLPLIQLQHHPDRGTFTFLVGVGNTVFLPLTLADVFWNQEMMALVILASIGSDFFVWTYGVTLFPRKKTGGNLRFNLPLIAIGVSLCLIYFGSENFMSHLHQKMSHFYWIGKMALPLSMIVLGMNLGKGMFSEIFKPIIFVGALIQLILLPLFAFFLGKWGILPEQIYPVFLLIAMMPSAIMGVILAEWYQGNAKLAAQLVFGSHILSIATIPFWTTIAGI